MYSSFRFTTSVAGTTPGLPCLYKHMFLIRPYLPLTPTSCCGYLAEISHMNPLSRISLPFVTAVPIGSLCPSCMRSGKRCCVACCVVLRGVASSKKLRELKWKKMLKVLSQSYKSQGSIQILTLFFLNHNIWLKPRLAAQARSTEYDPTPLVVLWRYVLRFAVVFVVALRVVLQCYARTG